MTQEGIIQKVIDRHIDCYKPQLNQEAEVSDIITALKEAQQELIERIRERSRGYFDSYEKLVMLEDLIGDSKE